jgi:hypothetical protein
MYVKTTAGWYRGQPSHKHTFLMLLRSMSEKCDDGATPALDAALTDDISNAITSLAVTSPDIPVPLPASSCIPHTHTHVVSDALHTVKAAKFIGKKTNKKICIKRYFRKLGWFFIRPQCVRVNKNFEYISLNET